MTRKKYKTNNLTADEAARKWADYMRLRRRPIKACWHCKRVFPNTLEYFADGRRGRVGVRCIECVAAHPVPTKVKQPCPCCGELTRLVRDRHAPSQQFIFLCHGCLRAVNWNLGVSGAARGRILQYVGWRLGAQENASTALPGEVEARDGNKQHHVSHLNSASPDDEAPAETPV